MSTLQPHMTELQIRVLATIYTLEVLSILFVGFRIYCRISYMKRLLVSDVFLLLGLGFQLGVQACNVVEVLETLQAYADANLPPLISSDAVFIQWVAFWCLRMSVGLLFLEIFPGKTTKIIVYSALLVITVTSWVPIFWMGACAWPLYGVPNQVVAIFTKCIKAGYSAMVMNTSAGLLFDIGAVVLPMRPVWSLNMSSGKKISLTFILALGWLTVASSALRFVLSIKSLTNGPLKPGMQTNYTIFAAVEMHVGLIAASLLTTWKVIQSRFPPKSVAAYFSSFTSSGAGESRNKHSRNASGKLIGKSTGSMAKDIEEFAMESRTGDESGLLRGQTPQGGITVQTGFSVTTSSRDRYDSNKEKGVETADVEITVGEGKRSF